MSNHNNSIDESQQAERANSTEQPQPSEQQAQSAEQPQLSGQTGVIYKITCLVNGKGYVGQTRQKLRKRIYKHKSAGKEGRPGIDAAIEKYGWENFTVEVLEECPVELLSEREIFFIAALETKAPNGYNLTDGGEGCAGFKHTDESRAKISATGKGKYAWNKGQKMPEEQKAKISASEKGKPAWNKGQKMPEEQKAKISASRKGKPSPQKGTKRSPETCAKISAARRGQPAPNKGKPRSEETKAKISASRKGQKGKPHTPETKAKMSAARKAYLAKKKLESQNNS